jgi:hypothetical protein
MGEHRQWARYWAEEPWGPYRDNLHAAMLCVQILRTVMKKGAKLPPLSQFMLVPAKQQKEKNALSFLAMLKANAAAHAKSKAKRK